jgi:hypothetical protein
MQLIQSNELKFFSDKRARIWDKLKGIDLMPTDLSSLVFYPIGFLPTLDFAVKLTSAPNISAKVFDYLDNEIGSYDSYSVSGQSTYMDLHIAASSLIEQQAGYYYIEFTVNSDVFYSDMFGWTDRTDELLKIKASTSSMNVGGYIINKLYTTTEFYLNSERLDINPKVEQDGQKVGAITRVIYSSMAVPREFDLSVNDSVYMFLSTLSIIQGNGSVEVTFGYETFNASDIYIELLESHGDGLYQVKFIFVDESESVSTVN